MDIPDRAAQFWSVLALAAENRQLLTYEILERLTGVPHFDQTRILSLIASYCDANELPKVTAIVVSAKDGLSHDKTETPAAMCGHQAEVFGYDWCNQRAPSPSEFKSLAAAAITS